MKLYRLDNTTAPEGNPIVTDPNPPAPRTFEDRFADAIRRDQETGALPKPDETPILENRSQ